MACYLPGRSRRRFRRQGSCSVPSPGRIQLTPGSGALTSLVGTAPRASGSGVIPVLWLWLEDRSVSPASSEGTHRRPAPGSGVPFVPRRFPWDFIRGLDTTCLVLLRAASRGPPARAFSSPSLIQACRPRSRLRAVLTAQARVRGPRSRCGSACPSSPPDLLSALLRRAGGLAWGGGRRGVLGGSHTGGWKVVTVAPSTNQALGASVLPDTDSRPAEWLWPVGHE